MLAEATTQNCVGILSSCQYHKKLVTDVVRRQCRVANVTSLYVTPSQACANSSREFHVGASVRIVPRRACAPPAPAQTHACRASSFCCPGAPAVLAPPAMTPAREQRFPVELLLTPGPKGYLTTAGEDIRIIGRPRASSRHQGKSTGLRSTATCFSGGAVNAWIGNSVAIQIRQSGKLANQPS